MRGDEVLTRFTVVAPHGERELIGFDFVPGWRL